MRRIKASKELSNSTGPTKSKNPQLALLKNEPKAYGGDLLKTRKGRQSGRPLSTKDSMHLVLRSSKAVGKWSFWQTKHKKEIRGILEKFGAKYGIQIYSTANVGNHLHLHVKLGSRHVYRPFIRAVTAAIAMAITGASRWNPIVKKPGDRFWDHRPFTRVVVGLRSFLSLRDYIEINRLQGDGFQRDQARFYWAMNRAGP